MGKYLHNAPTAMKRADVVIVGGGLVGASLATALSGHASTKSLSIVLVEPSPPSLTTLEQWPSQISLRTSTITPSSQAFLNDIGAWSELSEARIMPVDEMVVWDCPQAFDQGGSDRTESDNEFTSGLMHFHAADIGQDVLAHVVDNDSLQCALFRCLKKVIDGGERDLTVLQTGLKAIKPPRMVGEEIRSSKKDSNEDLEEDSGSQWPAVQLEDGSQIEARLIVACDGGRSKVRALCPTLQEGWFSKQYHKRAVVANVNVLDGSSRMIQRFLSTGPVAVLPVSDGGRAHSGGPMANIVWTTTETEALGLVSADDATFVDELNQALRGPDDGSSTEREHGFGLSSTIEQLATRIFASRHGPDTHARRMSDMEALVPTCTRVVGKRASFPLTVGHAAQYVCPKSRCVLLGDAAHVVHPFAGQGVNLGFADAETLVDSIGRAVACGRDFGGEQGAALHSFQAARVSGNLFAVAGLHALDGIFKPRGAFGMLRRIGMSAVQDCVPLRRAVLNYMR